MKPLTEMTAPTTTPVDDREGHLEFEPFSPTGWAVTILLVVLLFAIPIGSVIHYNREMARLDAAALGGQSRHAASTGQGDE